MSNNDVLSKLADDARRRRVSRNLPSGKLSWDWIRRVQTDLREVMERYGISQAQVAKRMGKGFSISIISQFLTMESEDIYIGDIDRITRGVNAFIEQYVRQQEAALPRDWVETKVAQRMIAVITNTIDMRSIGLIYSDAGRGKSMTLEAAHKIFPGSLLIRVRKTTSSPHGLAKAIAKALSLAGRNTLDLQDKIIDQLTGSDRPIMFDEAHQLTMGALEFVRDIHDICEVPVVFAGTHRIQDKTADNSEFFGQFTSRIGLRYDVTEEVRGGGDKAAPLHSVDEIKAIFESDKLRLTDDARELLCHISNILGIGGLRLPRQVLHVAARTVGDRGTIDAKRIRAVLRKLHGKNIAVTRIERVVRKVAAG